LFWEHHDPTQGMRQGNDVGTQYRSAIYTYGDAQLKAALASKEAYQKVLTKAGYKAITTEIREAPEFYYAEDYHQQYLAKNPWCSARRGARALDAPGRPRPRVGPAAPGRGFPPPCPRRPPPGGGGEWTASGENPEALVRAGRALSPPRRYDEAIVKLERATEL